MTIDIMEHSLKWQLVTPDFNSHLRKQTFDVASVRLIQLPHQTNNSERYLSPRQSSLSGMLNTKHYFKHPSSPPPTLPLFRSQFTHELLSPTSTEKQQQQPCCHSDAKQLPNSYNSSTCDEHPSSHQYNRGHNLGRNNSRGRERGDYVSISFLNFLTNDF